MGKRCQVCDGPIVDGRCKYCGMPYRCDAELYHLNEDRSEHYRHASAKVRKAMRESEIPLPDRSRTVSGTTKTQNVNARKTKNQTVKAQNIKTQDVRKQTAKKCVKNMAISGIFWERKPLFIQLSMNGS